MKEGMVGAERELRKFRQKAENLGLWHAFLDRKTRGCSRDDVLAILCLLRPPVGHRAPGEVNT